MRSGVQFSGAARGSKLRRRFQGGSTWKKLTDFVFGASYKSRDPKWVDAFLQIGGILKAGKKHIR
jgi:hypothetical protein